MRPYVKTIYSNLKSPLPDGEAWNIELSPRTLFVGSNTSHKSGVIQSVELALAGSADDIFGRNAVSDAALLLTLAPQDELGVTATLSNKQNASFNIVREGTKVRRPTHDGPGPDCLVHRSVASALSGSPASARKAFLSWSGDQVGLDDVIEYLPSELHNKYKDIAKFKGRDKSAVETLIDVAAYAGQKQREAAKEAKGADTLLTSLGNDINAKPSEDDMTRMRMAVAEAKSVLDRSVRASNMGMTLEEKNKQLEQARSRLSHFENDKLKTTRNRDELNATLPSKGDNVDHAIKIVDVAVAHGLEACPVCSSQVGIEHLKNCQQFYQAEQDKWSAASQTILAAVEKFDAALLGIDRQISDVRMLVSKLESADVRKVDSQIIPVADATSRLEAAMDAMTKMDNSCAQWDTFARAKDKVVRMKAEVENYKELKMSCEAAIGRLLADQTKTFAVRVQKYLPEAWEFSIQLLDGEREVFRMGIMRGNKLHAALSGAEWTAVVTAISMAVAEGLREDKPAVLIPEDRAWDGKTLAAVMRSFSNFDGQVIMASTTRPVGKTPKGWTIVEMDKVSASWLGEEEEVVAEVGEEEAPPSKTSLNHASGGFRVTTRSAMMLEEMGFDPDSIQKMSRDTVTAIIKSNILPENVRVSDDGGFYTVKGGNVLPMPPAPKV